MPLEGHWQRQNTPLRAVTRRELRAGAAAAALLIATLLVLVLSAGGSTPASKAGCVDATIASTTGAAQVHACGAEARRFCAQQRPGTALAQSVREQCRRLR